MLAPFSHNCCLICGFDSESLILSLFSGFRQVKHEGVAAGENGQNGMESIMKK